MTPGAGRGVGWHVWKRWCSVCAQEKAHVYPDGCRCVQCSCGAWLEVPALSVIEGSKR
jgi:hypothetical protein